MIPPSSGPRFPRTACLPSPANTNRKHKARPASPRRRPIAVGLGFLALWIPPGAVQAQSAPDEKIIATFQAGDYSKVIALTGQSAKSSRVLGEIRAVAFNRRGEQNFFARKITEAIADFDQYLASHPEKEPYHWQRGIAYYYAGLYEKGERQFNLHQTVNSQDVENAVWHFICAVRSPGGSVEKARKNFIHIEGDQRVPMKEVHSLFAGTGSPEVVLAAARAGNPPPEKLRNQLCYAHLYLGLYFEALGQDEQSSKHIRLAAEDYKMDHYMGRVAQVHAKLRGTL